MTIIDAGRSTWISVKDGESNPVRCSISARTNQEFFQVMRKVEKSGKSAVVRTGTPGRPRRLSRQSILDKSIELLDEGSYPFEDFTLARVAQELNTVSMALYNYFPSREALLGAVADHICMQFDMPASAAGQSWQQTLRIWLWTFRKHAERHPIIFKVMGFDGCTSAGWLRISMTVGKTLYEQGMRGKELALNSWLFCSNAISLVHYELIGYSFRSSISLGRLEELNAEEQEFYLMLRPYHVQISSDDALEEGFEQLIAHLAFKLGDGGTQARPGPRHP